MATREAGSAIVKLDRAECPYRILSECEIKRNDNNQPVKWRERITKLLICGTLVAISKRLGVRVLLISPGVDGFIESLDRGHVGDEKRAVDSVTVKPPRC